MFIKSEVINRRLSNLHRADGCAWHAVNRVEIKPGATVGVDNIGLGVLQIAKLAKLAQPGHLIVLDTKLYRPGLARQLGGDATIDVSRGRTPLTASAL